jgi:hypothetical protein
MPSCDVWDIDRDARRWPGGAPVVAHPPCRAWGKLRDKAKPRIDEKELALFAVDQVQSWGGVLEHPAQSSLWLYRCLPAPGQYDAFGGWTLPIVQSWFGHRAEKATWLYVVGVPMSKVPAMPLVLGRAPRVICQRTGKRKGMPGWRPEVTVDEREHTPPELAQWLVNLATRCGGELRAAA